MKILIRRPLQNTILILGHSDVKLLQSALGYDRVMCCRLQMNLVARINADLIVLRATTNLKICKIKDQVLSLLR